MNAPTVSLRGADLLAEIQRLKKERNAVILAHYYQKPEIQDLASGGPYLDASRSYNEVLEEARAKREGRRTR